MLSDCRRKCCQRCQAVGHCQALSGVCCQAVIPGLREQVVGKQGKGEPRISTPGHGQEAHGNRSSATWVSRPAPHCLPPSHNPTHTLSQPRLGTCESDVCVAPHSVERLCRPCSETPQAGEGEGGRGCGGAKFSSLDYVAGFTALLLRRKYVLLP